MNAPETENQRLSRERRESGERARRALDRNRAIRYAQNIDPAGTARNLADVVENVGDDNHPVWRAKR